MAFRRKVDNGIKIVLDEQLFHQMKKLLVTGGAGFIGSNFIQYILGKQQDLVLLLNLDLLTYAGNLEPLDGIPWNAYHWASNSSGV